MADITIITPTYPGMSWRLPQIAQELVPQMGPDDQWLVVSDGPFPEAVNVVHALLDDRVEYVEGLETRRNGNSQRQVGQILAGRDYIWFLDDSMQPLPHALAHLHGLERPVPHVFSLDMHNEDGSFDFRKPARRELDVEAKQVTAAQFIAPNVKEKLADWVKESKQQGDDRAWRRAGGYWLNKTMTFYDDVVWDDRVLARWFRDAGN